jgi:hypothetical protein
VADYTEPTTIKVPRGSTLIFTDGAGTPNTYRLRYASLTITNGGFNTVRATDESGDFIGAPQQGAQAGESSMAISGKMFGAGSNATNVALPDVASDQTAASAPMSGLTSDEADTNLFVWASVTLTLPDVGSAKGATYVLTKCTVAPGSTIAKADDGFDISVTVTSPNAQVDITENS